jgi:aldehyde:ferredoxin oxidoreductase
MKGNTGKIVNIDMTNGIVQIEALPEEYYKQYIGGSGLAAKIFWERGRFDIEPLAPEAMLIFTNGPFAGLKISGASRSSVAGCSPLTGHWGDSSSGGYFAPELRYAGYDGIILTGKAAKPSYLLIKDESIEILDASEYWGKGAGEVSAALKAKHGKDYRTLVVGPAGENLVKYSIILNESHHATGRAGFGAIMGSKNLKAIVVKATKKEMELANKEHYETYRKDLAARMVDTLPASVMHEEGTAAAMVMGMANGDVPVKNWQSNSWEEAGDALSGGALVAQYLTKRSACAFCGIACKRVVEVKDGPFAIPEGPGPEYETIAAFGTLIGSMDLAATCKAGRICNELGLDTISSGGTIAWAMEAFERGDLTLADTDNIPITWGDLATVIDVVLPAIVQRKGKLGQLLAEGSLAAAKKIGKGLEYTVQSKGLEAPMHDPRGGGHGVALSYAMSPRGACHVADSMVYCEVGARFYPEIGFDYLTGDNPLSDEKKPEAAIVAITFGAIENSACWCQIADALTIKDWLNLFNDVPGYDWDTDKLMKAGLRIFFLKRLINYRYGLTAADDCLTPRMLEPARDGAPEGIQMNFEGMKSRFYELTGFDIVKGIPTEAKLEEYGMAEEARNVW